MKLPALDSLVLVEWEDACSMGTRWQEASEFAKKKLATCRSVGWVCYVGKGRIILGANRSHVPEWADGVGDDFTTGMAIPLGCITRIKHLR